MEIDSRKQKILSIIIDEFVKSGEPVGSKTIASMLDNSVSSATIRNDMAALERLGLTGTTAYVFRKGAYSSGIPIVY